MQKNKLKITQIDSNKVIKSGESFYNSQSRKKEIPKAKQAYIEQSYNIQKQLKKDIKHLQNYVKIASFLIILALILGVIFDLALAAQPLVKIPIIIVLLSIASTIYTAWLDQTVNTIRSKTQELNQYK